MNFNILFTILLFFTNIVIAQVSFKTVIKQDNISIDNIFSVDFTADKEIKEFTPPNFKNFEIISGPSKAISNAWIKGKKSYSKHYFYKLKPLKSGSLNILSASAMFEGKKYETNPITLNIISLEEKVASNTTAYWKNKDKSKLILIDQNSFTGYDINKSFDYDKAKFYLSKEGQITSIPINEIIPKIRVKDIVNVIQMIKEGHSIITYANTISEFVITKLKKPKNNKKLVFTISFNENRFKSEEKAKQVELIKKYTYETIVYKYKKGKFTLKD